MLRVMNYRTFKNKDKTRDFHVVDLIDEQGNIACDVFVDGPLEIGSYVEVYERIWNHKLSCSVRPVAIKK